MSAAATTQQWKDLYEAADQYRQAAIWRWMSNGHLFGVRDPASEEIGYCSVFGNGGEMFGLAVYMGTGGLRTIADMLAGKLDEDPMFSQHCLLLSLDDRAELDPAEYKRIKQLGLGYRGKKSWPTFRLHEPGMMPWPELTAEQVVYMTQALEQARIVGEAYRDRPDALMGGEGEQLLVREAAPAGGGAYEWRSVWLEPAPLEETEAEAASSAPPLDELRIVKALKGAKGISGIWEADSFYVPMPIQEGSRPFFPKMALIVDQSSGQILKFGLSRGDEAAAAMNEHLLTLIEELKTVPRELWVGSESAGDALLPLAEALKLELMFSPELPALSEAREAMERRFS